MTTQAKPERPRGRPKASDSMPIEEILQKALNMFATVGYDGMSLRTLNRRSEEHTSELQSPA